MAGYVARVRLCDLIVNKIIRYLFAFVSFIITNSESVCTKGDPDKKKIVIKNVGSPTSLRYCRRLASLSTFAPLGLAGLLNSGPSTRASGSALSRVVSRTRADRSDLPLNLNPWSIYTDLNKRSWGGVPWSDVDPRNPLTSNALTRRLAFTLIFSQTSVGR